MKLFGFEIQKIGKKKIDTISPYLQNYQRLADLIAAIQLMGTYKFESRRWKDWQSQLDKPVSADNWLEITKEHPEFFRVSNPDEDGNEWISLRWRHGYDKNYWAEKGRELTPEESINFRGGHDFATITRRPLSSEQIESLISTAIQLHGRAIAHEEEKRWMIPLIIAVFTALAAFAGSILGAILGS